MFLWCDVINSQLEAVERWDRSNDPPGVLFQPWLLLWKPAMTHGKGAPPHSSTLLYSKAEPKMFFFASYFDLICSLYESSLS